ncbi:hypothetical protein OS493_030207 [Desmophyllum pertusum]|uniref:Uncharacterized protein n=1 Tax=Desmophyllum pertusum TaxID=174260 RepID=A0A9W9YJW1_9CNID|nr:hypothetical protein OS493_030207 [Desmophyllum pertusum]
MGASYVEICQKILESQFEKEVQGVSAGNFKIMAEKAGLCNICTELGAENVILLDQPT